MSFLVNVPKSVSADVVFSWIYGRDVACFDIALCSCRYRGKYENLLGSCDVGFNASRVSNIFFWQWLARRKLKPKSIVISSDFQNLDVDLAKLECIEMQLNNRNDCEACQRLDTQSIKKIILVTSEKKSISFDMNYESIIQKFERNVEEILFDICQPFELPNLSDCYRLHSLTLMKLVYTKGLSNILQCKSLKYLNLNCSFGYTDEIERPSAPTFAESCFISLPELEYMRLYIHIEYDRKAALLKLHSTKEASTVNLLHFMRLNGFYVDDLTVASYSNMQESAMTAIEKFTARNLLKLTLNTINHISFSVFADFLIRFERLQSLIIAQCGGFVITSAILQMINNSSLSKSLLHLSFHNEMQAAPTPLEASFTHFTQLTSLSLQLSSLLNLDFLGLDLLHTVPSLKELILGVKYKQMRVYDAAAQRMHFSGVSSRLSEEKLMQLCTVLSRSAITKVAFTRSNEEAMMQIMKAFPHGVQELDVAYAPGLPLLRELLTQHPLRSVVIQEACEFTAQEVNALLRDHPSIQHWKQYTVLVLDGSNRSSGGCYRVVKMAGLLPSLFYLPTSVTQLVLSECALRDPPLNSFKVPKKVIVAQKLPESDWKLKSSSHPKSAFGSSVTPKPKTPPVPSSSHPSLRTSMARTSLTPRKDSAKGSSGNEKTNSGGNASSAPVTKVSGSSEALPQYPLEQFAQLTSLELSHCYGSPNAAIAILEHATCLKSLKLQSGSVACDAVLAAVARFSSSTLEDLEIADKLPGNGKLTSSAISVAVQRCPRLRKCRISVGGMGPAQFCSLRATMRKSELHIVDNSYPGDKNDKPTGVATAAKKKVKLSRDKASAIDSLD